MRWARSIIMVALVTLGVNALPGEESHASLVPWKVLEPGEDVDAPLVLFWIPAAADELRRSPLLTSDALTSLSSRCVAMRVVRADDHARLATLRVEMELPVALLADRQGRVLATAESARGALSVREVEELVQEELDQRSAEADHRLDEAERRSEEGEDETALALYRSVWEERCLCPRQGRAAQRAMRRIEKR